MADRTKDLLEPSQSLAKFLANRYGSLKAVLSAGIIALYEAEPEWREYYMAKASGEESPELPKKKTTLRREILAVLKEYFQGVPGQTIPPELEALFQQLRRPRKDPSSSPAAKKRTSGQR